MNQGSFSPYINIRLKFGGLWNYVGWSVLFMGILFSWIFELNVVITSFVKFQGELSKTEGIVTDWVETNLEENDEDVYQIFYSFSYDGIKYSSYSFNTGRYIDEGKKVKVEFRQDNPNYSRIQGFRYSKSSLLILFIIIFPAVGLYIISLANKTSKKQKKLLENGFVSKGEFKSREEIEKDDKVTYKLTYDFKANNGKTYTKIYETSDQILEDERILYNPNDPSNSEFINDIPLNINGDSEVRDIGFNGDERIAVLDLVLPFLNVVLIIYIILASTIA